MLKILKKMAARQDDFSVHELPFLVRYFDYLAKPAFFNTFRRVWLLFPMDKREEALHQAFGSAYFNADSESDITALLKFIFAEAEKLTGQKIWNELFRQDLLHEIIQNVARLGSREGVDILIDYASRHIGKQAVKEMIASSSAGLKHLHMVEHFLHLSEKWGGKSLRKKFVESLDDSFTDVVLDLKDAEFAKYLLRLQYAAGGAKPVIESFVQLSEFAELIEEKEASSTVVTLINSLVDIGGIELAKAVLSHEKSLTVGIMASSGVSDINDAMMSLALLTEDQAFIAKTDYMINFGLISLADYERWMHSRLSIPRTEALSKNEIDDEIFMACRKWAEKHLKNATQADDYQLRNLVIQRMVGTGSMEDLKSFSRLHETLGEPGIFPEALTFFADAVFENRVEMFSFLADYALKQHGKRYVQSMLTQRDDEDEPLEVVAASGDLVAINAILDIATKAGGPDFAERLITGRENKLITIKTAERTGDFETVKALVELLSEENRQKAYEILLPERQLLAKKKMTKTAFYQAFGAAGSRWIGMTGNPPPHPALEEFSPYRFKPRLFADILPALELVDKIENTSTAAINAYKLSVLFSSVEEIDVYLRKYLSDWGPDSRQPIHDACLFEFPDEGEWNVKKWNALVLNYGPQAFRFLSRADKLEHYIGSNTFPGTLQELEVLVQRLSFKRSDENKPLATLAVRYGLDERKFNGLLDFAKKKGKTTDYLPAVLIDGNDLGHPDYYCTKLEPNDPIGYFLGDLTHCCQTVTKIGSACAYYGMSSIYSGFYVWKRKTDGQITGEDPIVAQSWAWIGQDNMLVLDSYEPQRSIHERLVQPFIEQFAHEVAGKYSFTDKRDRTERTIAGIRLGYGGQTPPLAISRTSDPSLPIDYKGQYPGGAEARDSWVQYDIKPIDHIGNPVPKLLPVTQSEAIDKLAFSYVAKTLTSLKKKFGVTLKAGIELECYAVGKDGKPTSQMPLIAQVKKDMSAAGISGAFDHENTEDYYGQYEASTTVENPNDAVKSAEKMRRLLQDNAKSYGLSRIDFAALPFKGKEASSAHISMSLWSGDDQPLLADEFGKPTRLLFDLIDRMLDFQFYTVLPFAQKDSDYLRFWNTKWSPCAIRAGESGETGPSLRVANANNYAWLADNPDPRDMRIENRLASADSSLPVAMAATVASIEFALDKMATEPRDVLVAGGEDDVLTTKAYPLPANRYEALLYIKAGEERGIFNVAAKKLFCAVADQHKPEPDKEIRAVTGDTHRIVTGRARPVVPKMTNAGARQTPEVLAVGSGKS
jgi:hypothetical protein